MVEVGGGGGRRGKEEEGKKEKIGSERKEGKGRKKGVSVAVTEIIFVLPKVSIIQAFSEEVYTNPWYKP